MESAAIRRDDGTATPMASLLLESGRPVVHHEFADKHRVFRIRSANTDGHRSSVALLVDKMSSWRKYDFRHR